ncbi:11301_t:CDS:10 [Funneliformis geosporum]|uniref:AP-1 complex subunit gamma n=1 Tax=Funneliformis geosporum TaxID=1117311 RepID=A0A9W4SR44_9GLOM|nr:11301_t:CDS:10 [Funneliformis geosporum]CAI2176103.1 4340_t:CDS:10 [Funneliformis geosporum]
MPFYRLKDLIKAIRACKTAADERAVIQKESAAIRTSFREENNDARHSNVAKLLYIHMLGYPAHFGQIECLKLVASNRFADKRLGYLGIMLLLDENQEVLTLVTNSLKNDMNHSNMYIVGLALCTLGNISSPEMARDLCAEVEKLLGSSNTYIRKKAALCAMRIIRKVPELQENFLPKAKALLSDRNHGVLLTATTLITEMCHRNSDTLITFRKAVPLLVRHLKSLVSAGFSPEHDVTGVTDPFLQVKILRLMRILGKGDAEASEAMNDILAQVATNTESSKNVGNSILYETVLTIMDIQSESGLRVLAINILGKFLTNRDNNIRYVALTTLNKTVSIDTNAVQRHRNIILDCLRDGDISIRRRALELSFALINETNVRVLTRELLAFLEVADNEFKQGMTTKICLAADRFAPNKRWHIDTVLRVLKLAGNYVREEILSNFIRLIAQTTELNAYTVQKLYAALKADISQESLTLAGVWVIGEYGDILIKGGCFEEEELVKEVTEPDVIDLFESILAGPYANQITREYVLTALMKLTSRLKSVSVIQRIQSILEGYNTSIEVEIQQRAIEYTNLFKFGDIRSAVLERMPIPEIKEETSRPTIMLVVSRIMGGQSLLDLDGDGIVTEVKSSETSQNTVDILADIFGGGSSANTTTAQSNPKNDIMSLFNAGTTLTSNLIQDTTASNPLDNLISTTSPPTSSSANDIMNIFGSTKLIAPAQNIQSGNPLNNLATSSTSSSIEANASEFTAYNKNGLKINLSPFKDQSNPNILNVNVTFHNVGVGSAVQNLLFQAATQRLQMQPPSSTTIEPGAVVTQTIRVNVRLRLRIVYETSAGDKADEIAEFSGFPQDLW